MLLPTNAAGTASTLSGGGPRLAPVAASASGPATLREMLQPEGNIQTSWLLFSFFFTFFSASTSCNVSLALHLLVSVNGKINLLLMSSSSTSSLLVKISPAYQKIFPKLLVFGFAPGYTRCSSQCQDAWPANFDTSMLRMPFLLRNAGSIFQRMMDRILSGLPFILVFLNVILVASPNHATHKQHICQVLPVCARMVSPF